MKRTRIKICGFTREADLDAAVDLGADAVGLVFYPPSKRHLSLDQALALRRRVPPFVSCVALTVNASPAQVEAILEQLRPDVLQFHGDESPEACERYGVPYLKAFRIGAPGLETPQALLESCERYHRAAAWLFDSHSPGYGGSGRSFDWSWLSSLAPSANARPVVLSGGLRAEKVVAAIAEVSPWALDVSSGVESAPGVKCPQLMAQFLQQVRQADASRSKA